MDTRTRIEELQVDIIKDWYKNANYQVAYVPQMEVYVLDDMEEVLSDDSLSVITHKKACEKIVKEMKIKDQIANTTYWEFEIRILSIEI